MLDGAVIATTDGEDSLHVRTTHSGEAESFQLLASAKGDSVDTDLVATYVVLLACIGYGVASWLVQRYRVAPPRDWLRERIWFLKAEIASRNWKLGEAAKDDLDKVEKSIAGFWLFVPLSKVQSGWRNVHALEDDHVLELEPGLVDERLRTLVTRLKAMDGDEAASYVTRIETALGSPGVSDHAKGALLREAEIFRHNINDTNYEDLANLLSKAVWLTCVALAITVALAFLFDRESFFLAGAAGGLISRLTRDFRRRPSASDYGAEWSTLILSPAAGALAAWVAVAIATALANDPFNVLGDQFAKPWEDAAAPLGLALGFLFGFSERLFDRLVSVAEGSVGGALPEDKAKVDKS